MSVNFLQMFETDPKELENYIRQIKSYEEQLDTIEQSAKKERELIKKRKRR